MLCECKQDIRDHPRKSWYFLESLQNIPNVLFYGPHNASFGFFSIIACPALLTSPGSKPSDCFASCFRVFPLKYETPPNSCTSCAVVNVLDPSLYSLRGSTLTHAVHHIELFHNIPVWMSVVLAPCHLLGGIPQLSSRKKLITQRKCVLTIVFPSIPKRDAGECNPSALPYYTYLVAATCFSSKFVHLVNFLKIAQMLWA